MLAALVVLALICLGMGGWIWTQRRALSAAARQLRVLEEENRTAQLCLEVPNRAAEELLDGVNRLLELRQADQAAYRAREQAIRRQISNISHDLRTPLTSILGYLQLLEGDSLTPEERQEYLTVVERRARSLQGLITGFYDLSRLEGDEYPLRRERVDVSAILSGLLAEFYNDFTDQGFQVSVELEEGVPPVIADPDGVTRIFINLLRNALDHGRDSMQVRLFREEGHVVAQVSNTTSELEEGDVPHVFDRFFTSDKMRTGRNTGLGLAIVKALAQRMGCQVTARLEEDWFTLRVIWNECG